MPVGSRRRVCTSACLSSLGGWFRPLGLPPAEVLAVAGPLPEAQLALPARSDALRPSKA